MGRTIRQTVYLDAPPHDVFEALMDSRKHTAFTGDRAKIDRTVGGTFSTFGGWAKGKLVRLEKDKVIVQSWRSDDFSTEDPESKVMFHLTKKGQGTRLLFVHSDVPENLAKDVAEGWRDYYWRPLKEYLTSKRK